MKLTLTLFLAAGLLMGCISLLPTPVLPTETAFAATQNVNVSALSTATVSRTPSPTSTTVPTETPDPILSTQESMISSCAATERTWYTKHLIHTYFMHENWGAFVCSDHGIYTRVSNESLNINWIVPSLDDGLNTSGPSWYWKPYIWSEDGKYLYLQSVCLCFIDSPWLIYTTGFGLSRLDLETGGHSIWLEPDVSGYYFDFSSDKRLFAFSPPGLYSTIKIRDLQSGKEKNLSFKEKYSILEFRWTPDRSRLVIFTEEYAEDKSKSGFSVFTYNVKSDVLKKLVNKNNLNSSFPTEQFIEPRIYISDLTNEILFLSDIFQESDFAINIRTGDLIKFDDSLTPMPTP